MAEKKDYDSTIARMAGNIAAGLVDREKFDRCGYIPGSEEIALAATHLARQILTLLKVKDANV